MAATEPHPPEANRRRTPGPPLGWIPRRALASRLSGDERVVLVVAPPGYGKTEVARQWSDEAEVAVGWLEVDLLDTAPAHFWRHLLDAVAEVVTELDDEPALLLAERGPADPVFLGALIEQVEQAGRRGALVIDDAWRLTDQSVLEGLALLVSRLGRLIRFVVIDRVDPPFPTALWRSRGWVREVRADHLRFSEQEALRIAAELPGLAISDAAVVALNERAEGWPIGLHLALVSIASEPEPESRAQALASSDRLLLDYLVSEVLDSLPAALREVALSLSVLRWFDSELCVELLGDDALPAADALRRRRLFLTSVDDAAPDAVRFHHLFRELLENELRWRDPDRRLRLHRRAAELWQARGDQTSAYHHLIAIGDVTAAADLVLPVAIDLVDHGDVTTLVHYMRRLPVDMPVTDPDRAFDLAQAWALAGGQHQAIRWAAVAERLSEEAGEGCRRRAHSTAAVIDLLQGSLASAWQHVREVERLDAGDGAMGPVDRQLPAFASRIALLDGHREEARRWIDRADDPEGPPLPLPLEQVVVPALRAWWELDHGDPARARALADDAADRAAALGLRPHFGAFDALMIGVRSRMAMGELRQADELLERVRADATQLGWTLPRVQAGVLAAEVARLRSGPATALAAIEELRRTVGSGCANELEVWMSLSEAVALIGCARFADAEERIDRLGDVHPRGRLLRARLVLEGRVQGDVAGLLEERGDWSTRWRIEGDLLLALASPRDEILSAALAEGGSAGWVAPYLDLAEVLEARIGPAAIDRLHPALGRALRARGPAASRPAVALVEPLTSRETTLLELLPTHLSYAELGDRLYLSVNTIKSNLKAIYRKLGVTSRTDAVETAWRLGLLEPTTPAARPPGAGARDR